MHIDLDKKKKNTCNPGKTVAVVVPFHKKELSDDEKISMNHLLRFLGNYDKYFVSPSGLKISYPGFRVKRFSEKYFKSTKRYSKLLLKKEFYQRFNDYEYILIYQLDSLVFSDQLLYWCKKGYDYIGAPWFKSQTDKLSIIYNRPDSCGNGGLSLRKISSFIKVIENAKKKALSLVIKELISSEISLFRSRESRQREYFKVIKNAWINSAIRRYSRNEDWFWSFEASKYYSDFKLPSPDIGLKFAFETGPKYCFKRNNHELPFGCHAWTKYDREFWSPCLLKGKEIEFIENKTKVSIITTCLNAEKTIENTIKSVVNQTYENIEYIVIDGGSRDGTLSIIKKYADKISYWTSEKDNGVAEGFNKGIKKATGEIIGILNSDDWYEKDTIRTVVDIDDQYRADFYIGALRYWPKSSSSFIVKPDFNFEKKLYYRMPTINHPASFFKRSVYENVGYYKENLKYAMDYDFFLRVVQEEMDCHVTKKVLANMNMEGTSDRNAVNAYIEVLTIAPHKIKARLWFFYSILKFYFRKILKFFKLNNVLNWIRKIKYD